MAVSDPALRPALLAQGEAALKRGDAAAALEAFERAALMLHAADAEMGIVRAMLQEGGYRRALAFAAHAAGAHRDAPAASALYAWLLATGGQGAFALRVLDEAAARSDRDALIGATRQALVQPMPAPPAALREPPQRAAPYAVMLAADAPPAALRGLGSGALVDGGRAALVACAIAPKPGDAHWLRDGLGRTLRADLESAAPGLGLALLRPRARLEGHAVAPLADSDPFAGAIGRAIAFAPSVDGEASWPWLFDGFFGPADGAAAGLRRLLIELPARCGGALWDARGQLAGIACAEPGRRWVPVSALRDAFGAALGTHVVEPPRARPTPDELYERALPQVVQVLVSADSTG